MLPIMQNILPNFVSAYGKHYSTNHALISLIENWKKNLDSNKIEHLLIFVTPLT